MRRELLIAAGPGEWRAALLEDGAAVELHVERGDTRPAGSIHLGRVLRRVAGLDAGLVDIGEERPGFLPVRRDPSAEGARVVVQVRREAQRGKGALLSGRLATGDAGRWTEAASRLDPPAQLHPAPGFAASLAARLPECPERAWVDDTTPLRDLRDVFPEAEIMHCPPGDWPLDLDAAFDAALAPSVALPGGGAIHIEEAHAAVLIDVDTGSPDTGSGERNALAVNLAAAPVIARQLRLRQLGGGIIVDFAALEGRGPRERVQGAVAAQLALDPAEPRLLGWTRLGHLELVRPRRFRSLGEAMLEPGGSRRNATTLAFAALRALYREARANPAKSWRLVAAPEVEAALRGPAAAALRGLETRLGRAITLDRAAGRGAEPFDIAAI
jgi:Ribonuclease G/E